MRLTALLIAATLIAAVPASGQEPPSEEQHPYGLDPYDPSDAALLRDYGVTLVSQTPIAELRKLDPYKPSHAALLRQLGGGIPLWGWAVRVTRARATDTVSASRLDESANGQSPSGAAARIRR